ncbi:hypothetical protein D920_00513 [Enterococcus faecalis 13-SD-W-01]|nr:hypothetical protein D920_00513 [Enterococcus faecalis 13-SD-W-01]
MYLFRKKNQEKIEKKKKTGRSRVPRIILFSGWSLLVFSVGFGVYNNLTAISTHTVHEKEVIKEQLIDTTGLQSYAKAFAQLYFTVSPTSKEQQEQREKLMDYLAENLTYPTSIYKDVKDKVFVKDVEVWEINAVPEEKNVYSILLKVMLEADKNTYERAYSINVYAKDNQFSVVKLPILATLPSKASVEVTQQMITNNVEATTRESVEGFLETFFAVYPKADEKELIYYGKELQPIKDNLTFLEITNTQMSENKQTVDIMCTVVYKDNETNLTFEMPYQLTLEKIVDGKFSVKELR